MGNRRTCILLEICGMVLSVPVVLSFFQEYEISAGPWFLKSAIFWVLPLLVLVYVSRHFCGRPSYVAVGATGLCAVKFIVFLILTGYFFVLSPPRFMVGHRKTLVDIYGRVADIGWLEVRTIERVKFARQMLREMAASQHDLPAPLPPDPLDPARRISARNDTTTTLYWSVGPDGIDQNAQVYYDPTNGVLSAGDIVLRVQDIPYRVVWPVW